MAGNIPGTRYSTARFLSRFGNLAQSSQYRSHIGFNQNLYNALVANDIPRSLLSEAGMLCKATSLPGSQVSTHDVRDFYGVVQKSAYMRQFDNTIDLTFYIDSNYQIMYLFEAWMEYIMPLVGKNPKSSTSSFVANYPDNYKCDLHLYKFNKDMDAQWTVVNPFRPKGSIVYSFINVFPQNISSADVSYDPSQNLEFTVTFSYERYITNKTGIRNPGNLGQDSFSGRSQPMKNTSKDNPSNPILHKDGSKSVISKEDQELTKDIGQKQYPIDNGQNTNSTVNQEIGEPGTGSQATKGNTNIDGLVGDFGSQDSSAGQTSGDKSLRRFGTGSNSIA